MPTVSCNWPLHLLSGLTLVFDHHHRVSDKKGLLEKGFGKIEKWTKSNPSMYFERTFNVQPNFR